MDNIVVLTGPTSVGKTALSIRLAKEINGAVISADSMQVYRHMDIGSAKIMPSEMDQVPHYLIDVLEPDEDFNVARFKAMAKEAVSDIYARGMIPIVVGGTGFYIQALLYNIDFKEEPENSEIRDQLQNILSEKGADYLHGILLKIDPESAGMIHKNNTKRVIRAIEYYRLTGEKISLHNKNERMRPSPYNFAYFVLNDKRERIYERIDKRVDAMIEDGLVDEVRRLKDMGCKRNMVSMQGLGYKEILDYLNGDISLDEAIYIIKRETRHFAKRQITWFKRERSVTWINKDEFSYDGDAIFEAVLKTLRDKNII